MKTITHFDANFAGSLRALLRTLACALVIALLMINAKGQAATDGSTPLGLSPGSPAGSYPLSDIDTVNLYNGTLNFRLPFLGVVGRGGAGYPMTLNIEKKWTVHKHLEPGVGAFYYADGGWWSEEDEGWRLFNTGKVDIRSARREQPTGFPVEALTRVTFRAPDGTEYELRDLQTNGQPKTPSGGFNRGKVFVTSDGSSATFVSDWDIVDDPTNGQGGYDDRPDGVLLLKDGTRLRVDDGKISWMHDRNGNKVSFAYDFLRRVTGVTDSLGRQTTITYPSGGVTFTSITFKGFGRATRTIKIGQTNLGSALRSGYSIQPIGVLFPTLHGGGPVDPTVVDYVELPDGRRYQFQYNDYAELARIILPTGGAIEYDYAAGLTDGAASGVFTMGNKKFIYRRVTERRLYPDGGSGAAYESKMTYSRPETNTTNAGYVISEQRANAGALLASSKHFFYGSPRVSFNQEPTHYGGCQDGREYQTEVFDTNGTTILKRSTSTFAQRAPVSWWTGTAETAPPNDPRLIETVTTIEPSGANLVSKQTFSYDQYNNQTDVYEYGFGTGSVGALVRRSHTDFVTTNSVNGVAYNTLNPNTTNPSLTATFHIRNLPDQTFTYDSSGVEKARTTFEYDNYTPDQGSLHYSLTPRSSIIGLCDGSAQVCLTSPNFTDPAFTKRGNATRLSRWLLPSTELKAYSHYDVAGNVVKAIDPRSTPTNVIATTFDFLDFFGTPNGEAQSNSGATELAGLTSYAFPTSVTNHLGHVTRSQFDFYLGKAVDVEDANGIAYSAHYSDLLDRPTQMIKASNQGPSVKTQTTFGYDDVNRTVTTTSDQSVFNDPNPLKSQTLYDLMGRTIETRQYENSTDYIAVRQVPFVIEQDPDTLAWVAAAKSSNAFRPYLGEQALWTTSFSDTLGRTTNVRTPDNAIVRTSYSGNNVTVTDQNAKSRKSVTDALGRLKEVYEDPTGLNYLTSYGYDVLDNLTTVTQGSQTRSFAYDSLKRLSSATNPESGTISYQYDANGNLIQKTDARGLVSAYSHDALNRNTTVTYTNDPSNTPAVNRYYDGWRDGVFTNIPNVKGRLWQTETAGANGSRTTTNSFDAVGRPLSESRQFYASGVFGQAYTTLRGYNLAGGVTSQTYPSGRTVSYAYDNVGRTNSFSGNLGDGTNRTYASGIVYSSMGGVTKEQFGTDTPVYNKSFYNSRGQLSEIRVSTSYTGPTDTTWNRGAIINHYSNNCWGMCGGSNSTTAMTDNNGNLKKQEVYIPANDQVSSYTTWWQQYDYDPLNRLRWVKEFNSGNTQLWQQEYVYDRYGNRTLHQTNTWGAGINKKDFTVNTANNLLGVPGGQTGTMTYDDAGNLTTDTYSGAGVTRAYDAENRMTSETQANNYLAGVYTYNADGQRVRRKIGGVETWQVYGMDGELLAEYAAANPTVTAPQKEYGYRNGQLLVTAEPGSGSEPQNVTWTNVAGVSASGNSLAKTAATGWGNAGAVSTQALVSGDGWVEFTVTELNTYRMVGLSNGDSTQDGTDIDFALMTNCDDPGNLKVRITEAGVVRGDFGTFTTGDKLRVAVEGGVVKYRRNGTLLYSSSVAPVYPLLVDTALYSAGATVTNAIISTSSGPMSATINWLVTDQLGTPRMVVDQTGSLASVKRHDYLPFGEELFAGTGGRTTGLGYAGDTVRQKFTQKERDIETGLDFFEARYYASTQGRFTSADDFLNDTSPVDPASWNLYAYVRNNPLRYIDPTGEKIYAGGVTGADRDELLRRANFTYGCESCVSVDKDGFLAVNTTGLSQDVLKAAGFLTDAINSNDPSKLFSVQVTNGNSDVAFGDSQAGAAGVQLPGNNFKTSAVRIRLDFGDDKWVSGDKAAKSAFLNLVFAHEVKHFYPNYIQDPTDGRQTGPVVDAVNEIQQARGLLLRAEYGATKRTSGGEFVSLNFGTARTDRRGNIARNRAGGIEVNRTNKVVTWIKRTVGGKGIN